MTRDNYDWVRDAFENAFSSNFESRRSRWNRVENATSNKVKAVEMVPVMCDGLLTYVEPISTNLHFGFDFTINPQV